MAPSSAGMGLLDPEARYRIWKEQHVPLLYDWISSRKLVWPNAALQWGSRVSDATRSRSGGESPNYSTRALYLAERTGDAVEPNTLLYVDARVNSEHTARSADVAKPWRDESVSNARSDGVSTPDFWLRKRIIHPGEVNKIRLVLPGVVVTHTDRPELYVWDFARQENRKKDSPKTKHNIPTCVLSGHSQNAEYALSVARSHGNGNIDASTKNHDPWIASGGMDCRVLVWRLNDYQSGKGSIREWVAFPANKSTGGSGHRNQIEDVSFCGRDRNMLASVGRDKALLFWDVRQPVRAASSVVGAHQDDINSCDFGGVDINLLLTGGSDTCVRTWDRRMLCASDGTAHPVGEYKEHDAQINTVMWNPHRANVFASAGDDGQVLVWDRSQTTRPGAASVSSCPELLFRHVGHQSQRENATVVDCEWLPDETDPWCIASISEILGESGGSTLQIWRMSSMIYSPQEVVAAELRALQA